MRIAQFTNTYAPTISGVVRNVINLQHSLSRIGSEVFVFTERRAGTQNNHPNVFHYPTLDMRLNMDFPAVFSNSPHIDSMLPKLQLDIIHTHHPFLLGYAALSKGRRLGIPVVFTFHTLYWEHAHYFPIPFLERYARIIIMKRITDFMRRCDRVIVYTEDLKEMLCARFGLRGKVSVVPTAIDLEPFKGSPREALRADLGWGRDPVLISISRLGREKNWYTLLAAAIKTLDTFPNLRIVVIGEGPERRKLEHFAAQKGGSSITFLGKVPLEEIPKYLNAADVFAFASVTETMGRVTMEAIAAGLPVAAVDAPGTRAIVTHKKEGLLTPNDPNALSEAICRLIQNKSMRDQFGRAAVEKAKSFPLNREGELTHQVYQQVIENYKGQGKELAR